MWLMNFDSSAVVWSFQLMVFEQLNQHQYARKKMNLNLTFMPDTKKPSKLTKYQVKYKTIILLKENVGENLHDLGLGKNFSSMTPEVCNP